VTSRLGTGKSLTFFFQCTQKVSHSDKKKNQHRQVHQGLPEHSQGDHGVGHKLPLHLSQIQEDPQQSLEIFATSTGEEEKIFCSLLKSTSSVDADCIK
jgi:hypothetical protein